MTKRLIDTAGAMLALILLSPVWAAAALAIRLTMGRPVLFRQPRCGLNGRVFELYKFRTMSDARNAAGELLPDEQRLTRWGRRLRRLSIDELPQLWNVLRGDMSLVGPRPLLPVYMERYNPVQRRRLEVRPGITGWCQINGRNALDWDEKFARDVWYVEHRGLWLDLQILARTIPAVLRRQGISQAGHATMPEFLGSPHGR
ncbi:MAG TPA: sugar transferase [Bryobacteraceae bacterium]|nr:sugar transferase [Bryobacteraceae bacterium]